MNLLSTSPIIVECLLGLVFCIWEIPGYILEVEEGCFALRFLGVLSVSPDTIGIAY
jgi:hypothetical protein